VKRQFTNHLIFIVLVIALGITGLRADVQEKRNILMGTWTLEGYQAMCEGDTLSITFQQQGFSYLNNNDYYLWEYEGDWRLNQDTVYTKLNKCSFLDYQSPFKFEWITGLESHSLINKKDIKNDQKEWWHNWFDKQEKWHPQYILTSSSSLKVIWDLNEDEIIWRKSKEAEKLEDLSLFAEKIKYYTANCTTGEPWTFEEYLRSTNNSKDDSPSIEFQMNEDGSYNIYVNYKTTPYVYPYGSAETEYQFCCYGCAMVTREIKQKTKFLIVDFRISGKTSEGLRANWQERWTIKTKSCRQAFPTQSIYGEDLGILETSVEKKKLTGDR